jgi:hypothetical protein
MKHGTDIQTSFNVVFQTKIVSSIEQNKSFCIFQTFIVILNVHFKY